MKDLILDEKMKKFDIDIDIVVATVPRRFRGASFPDAAQLPESLGRLKAVCQHAGFSCKTFDFSIKYFRKSFVKQKIFYELEKWLVDNIKKPYEDTPLSSEARTFWDNILEEWADTIASVNPEWFGPSIFADECTKAAHDLCKVLKRKHPNIKIVIGGLAVQNGVGRRDNKGYRTGDLFMDNNLCDAFITGEGEESLVEMLKGNMDYPGINDYEPRQIKELASFPFPDYSDCNFNDYIVPDPSDLTQAYMPQIVISFSRGCPMPCNFCEVKYYHAKYVQREPLNTAREMIHHYHTYGTKRFFFSDNLLNARPKQLKMFLQALIKWQEDNDVKFEMESMFIIKPESKFPEEMFELMKKAGINVAIYGVETGSQAVRDAMRKMYTDEDLYYTINMCLKYDIQPSTMIIVGYPSETDEDFQKTLELLRYYAPKTPDDPKRDMFVITPFGIDIYSDINQDSASFGIERDEDDDWTSPHTSWKEACSRAIEAWKVLEKLGYDINDTELGIKNSGEEWEKIIQGRKE